MKMSELNQEEKNMLKAIMGNQYASGPFSGMIFNKVNDIMRNIDAPLSVEFEEQTIFEVTKLALKVRSELTKLSGEKQV